MSTQATPPGGVGQRIRELRGGQSQREFAARLGMKAQQLNRYERGRVPDPEVLLKLARISGTTVDWLLTGHVDEQGAAYRTEPRAWQASLEPALAGSPLEGALPRLEVGRAESSAGLDDAWRALDDERKDEARRTLRNMAAAATVLERLLPKPIAEELNGQLAARAVTYIEDLLGR